MAALSYYEMVEAVKKGVNEVLERAFNDIEAVFKRDAQVKLPVSITLTAAGASGQVDVVTSINFVTNENDRPERFKPVSFKHHKKIRLNPSQRQLPGQGE